jgi:hypothetical protein
MVLLFAQAITKTAKIHPVCAGVNTPNRLLSLLAILFAFILISCSGIALV